MSQTGPVLKPAEEEEQGLLKKDINKADIASGKYKRR